MTKWRKMVVAGALALTFLPFLPSTARACSCAAPTDLAAFVGEADAAFVGTLVDRRDTPDFQAIYVFEVEEWVKGDVGEVIEVQSGQGGGDCGFEFWDPDQRIGALLYHDGGELHGGMCSQVEPAELIDVSFEDGFVHSTPPLIAPEMGVEAESTAGLRWLAGTAVAVFMAMLVLLTLHGGRGETD